MMTLEDVRSSTCAVITIKDAARLLGVNPRTVSAALTLNGGDIPARRVGRRVVIPRVPWLAWLDGDGTTHTGTADQPPTQAEPDTAAIVRAKLLELLAELEGTG